MFFSDPVTAIREMLRVVRRGGRIALAVWGDSRKNPYFQVITEILSRYVEPVPEDQDAPGAFRFAEAGKLSRIVGEAGATEIVEQRLDFRIEAPISLEQFWQVRSEMSDTLREKISRLTPEQLSRVVEEVRQAARPFFQTGKMSFPAEAIIIRAVKA
jgi:SAM-dependent methyltransferase